MTQPPLPPQQQPLPPPGFLRLHLQGNRLVGLIVPTVRIDGHPVRVDYGENVVPVFPGRHRVDIHAQWMWQYGQAGADFAVREGETAQLWYAMPMLTFLKGAIGPHKQRMPGLWAMVIGSLLLIALVVGIVVLALANA